MKTGKSKQETQKEVDRLTRKYVAKSIREKTKIEYESRIRMYESSGRRLPTTPVKIVQYLETAKASARLKNGDIRQSNKPLSVSSLVSVVSALSWWHKEHGKDDPTKSPLVKAALAAIKRERETAKNQARAITMEEINRIAQALITIIEDDRFYKSKVEAARDLCFLLMLFYTGCRESEIRTLKAENLKFTDDGIIVTIPKSKKDDGTGRNTPIPNKDINGKEIIAVRAIQYWLQISNIRHGYLFRHIDPFGQIITTGKPPSYQWTMAVIKRAALLADIDTSELTTHSFRTGCATSLQLAGVDIVEIAQHLGHNEIKSTMGYFRRNPKLRITNAPTKKLTYGEKTGWLQNALDAFKP